MGYYRVLAGLARSAPFQETRAPGLQQGRGLLVSEQHYAVSQLAENLTVNQGYAGSTPACAASISGEWCNWEHAAL